MKVAIFGTAQGWQETPFNDPSYEIWGLNDSYELLSDSQLRRISRWFELHGDTALTRSRRPTEHWQRLSALGERGVPVYTLFDLPEVVAAIRLDLVPLVAIKDYFACTCAYQIALAICEGATTIELYGTPFLGPREALVERPCVEWWLGFADGKGVTTKVHHDYTHGLGRHSYRYAADDPNERLDVLRFVKYERDLASAWLQSEEVRLGLHESEQTFTAAQAPLVAVSWWNRVLEYFSA